MEHGGDIYTEGILKGKKILDFSSNINPLGVPLKFKNNINEALKSVQVYPDIKYRFLKKYIVNYVKNGICNENIVLGNGASEIIDQVIGRIKSICIPVPSFIEYEKNAVKWNCKISFSELKDDMSYNYEDIYSKMEFLDALIIGNPNNPSGGIIDVSKFVPILDFCESNNKKIIIDEAFIEFTAENGFDFTRLVKKYKCIFVIRAITKFFAMPGIRFGYGISGDIDFINSIKKSQNPWNVNCFAEIAVKYSLSDKDYITKSLKWISEERNFMITSLNNLDIIEKAYETYSNFILCKLKYIDCNKLYDICMKNYIAVRKCDNFRGLDNSFVRFAIKDRESNSRLINVLKGGTVKGVC
ncbi:aminotransferase class I/II-fold pyridoxal phosphate-dependent enzyme [Clostridium fermenticellae]|uniref:Aminotransferase class I/II-fold pyridoxal phosphate-dependent enzyme n=1 Tax=Clostridium fermenticellae TaxID=2068654 RepID=A0A386H5L5_9CLOT|nr:histidinol-phosphate transaminase [Clostridium fermenticellae]AYD41041.1 aminotransferase class I/II-fold pyridoxal phosphate-dependent enzyme [Clostridium fermenticellae]